MSGIYCHSQISRNNSGGKSFVHSENFDSTQYACIDFVLKENLKTHTHINKVKVLQLQAFS